MILLQIDRVKFKSQKKTQIQKNPLIYQDELINQKLISIN